MFLIYCLLRRTVQTPQSHSTKKKKDTSESDTNTRESIVFSFELFNVEGGCCGNDRWIRKQAASDCFSC